MRKMVTTVVISLLVLGLGGVLVYVDHERSHPDRVAATRRVDEMISVRDQILRFQDEYGGLPRTLDDLIGRYVRTDQLMSGDVPLYVYDPAGRELRQALGSIIHGLWTRRRSPVTMTLPPPDPSVAARLKAETLSVRDQLMRYEQQHGVLPRTLDQLVGRFLSPDQLARGGSPLYGYEPEKRQLTRLSERVFGTTPAHEVIPPPETPTSSGDAPPRHPADETPDLLADDIAVRPKGPGLPEAPPGAMVFEAENFTEMNWGWEVRPDVAASGGGYLHCWEGITNGPAQTDYGVYDFFDVRPKKEYTRLRYHFRVPNTDEYYVYARMWTTDTHCSNAVNVGIDQGGPGTGYVGNRMPFRWLWTRVGGDSVTLKAGDHFLHIFIHEDGIRFDQFIVSPTPVMGTKAYRPNLLPGKGTAWQKQTGPAVHLSFDLKSQVLAPTTPPDCKVVLRRLRAAAGEAELRVTLKDAGLGGRDWRVARYKVELSRLPEVCWVPLSFADLDLAGLERREYLLRAELVSGGKTLASTRVTLLKPFMWEVCGPYPFMPTGYRGPLDGDREPKSGDKRKWTPLKLSSMDHFGVLDFGVHTIGSSLHAPQDKTIYARTRFHVPEAGTYVFLIQSDDHMLLWLDGKLVYRFDEGQYYFPVTRSAKRHRLKLSAGEHRLRMRVNQTHTRWQACVRIRNADDGLSNVVGLSRPAGGPPK